VGGANWLILTIGNIAHKLCIVCNGLRTLDFEQEASKREASRSFRRLEFSRNSGLLFSNMIGCRQIESRPCTRPIQVTVRVLAKYGVEGKPLLELAHALVGNVGIQGEINRVCIHESYVHYTVPKILI
jgi:hypothetical protein